MDSKRYDNFFDGRIVLVTGGAGFIGSHLTQHLAGLGATVRVLDDFSSGIRANLDGIELSLIEGSILDTAAVDEAIKSATASALVRSIFPLRKARMVNSPGFAVLAPAFTSS